jgi:hypothetical protein
MFLANIHQQTMRDVYLTNVTMQVVERHFLRGIQGVMDSMGSIWKNEDNSYNVKFIEGLVAESQDSIEEKKRLEDKKAACEDILDQLRRGVSV